MKKLLSAVMMAGLIATAAAAETEDRSLFPGDVSLGGGMGASIIDREPVGTLDLGVTLPATNWLDVGLNLVAVHTLERSYEDGSGRSYQAEIAYGTTVLRPNLALGDRVEIGLPLGLGRGVLQFRYEHEYREDMTWPEEILDRVTYMVGTAGGDLRVSLGDHWGLMAEGGYRVTGWLSTDYAEDDALLGPYGRLGMIYRIR